MRDELLSKIKLIQSINYKISDELPFSNSGIPLYTKNVKVVYVDNQRINTTVLYPVLSGINIEQEITSIKVYFTNDAKKVPSDYQQFISNMKSIKDQVVGNYFKRECIVDISYNNDIAITMLDYQFTNIKGN